MFFAQHFDDLTWAAGQSILAEHVKELTDMIIEAMGNSSKSSVWNSDIFQGVGLSDTSQAIDWAQRHFKFKADAAKRVVRSNAQTSTEATLCRYVDNFNCYLSDLLTLLFTKYPRSLNDGDGTISVKDLFGHTDVTTLISSLANRTVSDLSRKGFADVEAYYEKRFGFCLIPDESRRQSVTFAIAARNLLVHRRGMIDSRFIAMTNSGHHKVGHRIDLGNRVWNEFLPDLLRSVHEIDKRAATKFDFQAAFVLPPNKGADDRLLES